MQRPKSAKGTVLRDIQGRENKLQSCPQTSEHSYGAPEQGGVGEVFNYPIIVIKFVYLHVCLIVFVICFGGRFFSGVVEKHSYGRGIIIIELACVHTE